MHTRSKAAATALLLVATAGLAAAGGGAAQAARSQTPDRAAPKLVVTIKTVAGALHLSDTRIRPGKTIFKGAPHGKGGDLQVFRLRAGYTLKQGFTDLNNAFAGDVPSVKRVDRNIVFYGGNQFNPKGGDPTFWGVKIDHTGKYYVLNIDTNALTSFKVAGAPQRRSLPAAGGWLNMATASDGVTNVFRVGQHNPKAGFMRTTNNAKEPHFVDLGHVKAGTTTTDVENYFSDPNAPEVPPFAAPDGAAAAAGVISPGKTMVWSYSLPKGEFLVTCFWPSKINGMPHALMGMFKLFNLG